ncbi:hypothetical protein WMY93_022207 [Mugilogobius chulae]|uniref:CCHC-type domain-containing protein n=1 Tax=Mugilogobius chulae TaxID=88201 RepID=A0AAW0N691_9GOBI
MQQGSLQEQGLGPKPSNSYLPGRGDTMITKVVHAESAAGTNKSTTPSSNTKMASAAPLQRRNAARFELLDGLEMERLDFSRRVLQRELGISTNQLDFIFALPGKKIFEVVFTTFKHVESSLAEFEKKKASSPLLGKMTLTPLTDMDKRTVFVVLYSERAKLEDIHTWAANYCDVLDIREVIDLDGIKTGTRRLNVRLRRENGTLKHLPNTIQLGSLRGTVFYAGQPKQCRKCGSLNHLAAQCTTIYCRNCKSTDHAATQCPIPIKCNLCSSDSHRFKDCPNAYANRVKQNTMQAELRAVPDEPFNINWDVEVQDEAEEPQDTTKEPQDIPSTVEVDQASLLLQQKVQGAEKLFDKILANLPSQVCAGLEEKKHTAVLETISQPDLEGIFMSSSPGKDEERPTSPEVIFHPLPNTLVSQQTPQKRPQESSSEESGHLEQLGKEWPVLSTPFLDPECLNNFSSVTQMRDPEEDTSGAKRKELRRKRK